MNNLCTSRTFSSLLLRETFAHPNATIYLYQSACVTTSPDCRMEGLEHHAFYFMERSDATYVTHTHQTVALLA